MTFLRLLNDPEGDHACLAYLLTHVIRTPPDPDGQDATTGPDGPYVGGGPVGPAHCLPALKSCKHLIPDHADPVVQHDAESDTA